MSTSLKSGRTFTLVPLFEFFLSFFVPKETHKASTKQQSHETPIDESQSSPSKISKRPKLSESIRTFTLGLHKYIHTISEAPANIDREMIETLQRLKDALSDHKDVLNGLTHLYYGETDTEKRLPLYQSLERGVQTNGVIYKFIWDCCHDGHPRGLLKHRMETAFFSDRLVRATDEQLSVIYAYKVAKGEPLLS